MLRDARGELARQLFVIQHELDLARVIQLSILPHQLPKIEGLEIAARYLPMSTVAGDFYDFLIVDEKHIGMLVADVSGHGPAAALIASMLRIALAAQLPCASEPAKVLWGLNKALCGNLGHNFVTAAYGVCRYGKRCSEVRGAGAPTAAVVEQIRWKHSEKLRRMVCFLASSLTRLTLPWRCRSRLVTGAVLYTDGIPECRNPMKEEFGTEQVHAVHGREPWPRCK